MPEPTPDVPQRTLKQTQAALAAATVLKDYAAAQVDELRAELTTRFKALHAESGSKSFNVEFPGLGKVANISLTESSDKVAVVDEAAFTAWVEAHYPTEIEYRDPVVRPAWQKTFLEKGVTRDFDGEVAIDPATGEVVPGVKVTRGGEIKGLTGLTGFKKEQVFEALRDLQMSAALGITTGADPVAGDTETATQGQQVVEGQVVTEDLPVTAALIGKMKRPEVRQLLEGRGVPVEDLVGSLPQLRQRLIQSLGLDA